MRQSFFLSNQRLLGGCLFPFRALDEQSDFAQHHLHSFSLLHIERADELQEPLVSRVEFIFYVRPELTKCGLLRRSDFQLPAGRGLAVLQRELFFVQGLQIGPSIFLPLWYSPNCPSPHARWTVKVLRFRDSNPRFACQKPGLSPPAPAAAARGRAKSVRNRSLAPPGVPSRYANAPRAFWSAAAETGAAARSRTPTPGLAPSSSRCVRVCVWRGHASRNRVSLPRLLPTNLLSQPVRPERADR